MFSNFKRRRNLKIPTKNVKKMLIFKSVQQVAYFRSSKASLLLTVLIVSVALAVAQPSAVPTSTSVAVRAVVESSSVTSIAPVNPTTVATISKLSRRNRSSAPSKPTKEPPVKTKHPQSSPPPTGGTASNGKIMRTRGDFVFGGIFPMHEQISTNSDYPCGAVKEEKGVQRLEAMLYAIDLINNDPTILPNVTLGVVIIDSCSSDTYALEQSMEFVRYYMNKVSISFEFVTFLDFLNS